MAGGRATGVEISAEPPDGDLAAGLLERYYAELAERFPAGFDLSRTVAAPAADLMPPSGRFLVARVDGVPAGCGAVRVLDAATAEVKRMWVDPAVRGRGVGRRMLAALEDAALDLDRGVVRLDSSAHLTEALALYASSGYREIPAYNDNPYAAHWLEKHLA